MNASPSDEYPNRVPESVQVSVCMTTYNHAQFIEEAVQSVLEQETHFPFEICLGEDESNDGTREICIRFAQKYPEIIRLFLRHRKDVIHINGRPTGRYNFTQTLKAARGKYIALLEGDDRWGDPKKLQIQYDVLEQNPNVAACYHDAFYIRDEKETSETVLRPVNRRNFSARELMTTRSMFLTLSLFFRNNPVIQDFPVEGLRACNGDRFLGALLGSFGSGLYLPQIQQGFYRVHSGGIWSQVQNSEKNMGSLTTWFWLSNYYQRTKAPPYLFRALKSRCMEEILAELSLSDRLKIIFQFFSHSLVSAVRRLVDRSSKNEN